MMHTELYPPNCIELFIKQKSLKRDGVIAPDGRILDGRKQKLHDLILRTTKTRANYAKKMQVQGQPETHNILSIMNR